MSAATVSIFISAGGNCEVTCSEPICVGSEFIVMFCAYPGVRGLLGEHGEHLEDPIDNTSVNHNSTQGGCEASFASSERPADHVVRQPVRADPDHRVHLGNAQGELWLIWAPSAD